VIPDATLTMSQIDNKAKHELHSDANGNFRFVGLPSGDYVLEATYIGFAPLREAVAIAQEQNVHRNLTLQVGSIVETIHIAGGTDARPDVQVSPAPQTPFESRPCSPIAVGGNIRAPRKIRDVKPEYPQMPGGAQAEGSVVLAARIGTDGFVKELRIVSAASPEMKRAASTAVSQWQFTPTFLNCEPIEVGMTVTANFRS